MCQLDLREQNRQCSDSRVLCVITILTGYMSSHVLSSVLTAHSVIATNMSSFVLNHWEQLQKNKDLYR